MTDPSPTWRTVAACGASTVVGTATAVAVTLATEWKTDGRAWAAVAALTLLTFAGAMWGRRGGRAVPGGSGGDGPTVGGHQVSGTTVAGSVFQFGDVTGPVTIHSGPPGRRSLSVPAAVAVAVALVLAFTVLVVGPGAASRSAGAVPAPDSPCVAAVADPAADRRIHEIWPSSTANVPTTLPGGRPARTDFAVCANYLRSVEVAAAPDGQRVLLRVLDGDGRELASQEVTVGGYRAKAVFEFPVDVRRFREQHLWLEVRSSTGDPLRVYLTPAEADPDVTATLPCGTAMCEAAGGVDLSAMVVGRDAPW